MMVSLIRTIILYVLIIFAVRLMGKRQISELQTSELVVTMLISDLASIPMQNAGIPIVSGIIPIVVLIAFEILSSVLMLKNRKFRRFICGKPILVIDDGKINQKAMKDLRMSTDDLSEQLRQIDVFSLQDVAYAIIETNGKMSVMKKPNKQQVDAEMLGLSPSDEGLETVVISDGEISDYSLSVCGLSKSWVMSILNEKNINLSDVFIMTANKSKKYNIIEKEDLK